mgnify:CR=1 FL=1
MYIYLLLFYLWMVYVPNYWFPSLCRGHSLQWPVNIISLCLTQRHMSHYKYIRVSGHCNLTPCDIYIHDVYRIVSDHCNHIMYIYSSVSGHCNHIMYIYSSVSGHMTHVHSLECWWSLQTLSHLPWSWWPSGGPSASWYTSVPLPRYKPTAHRITSGRTIRLSHNV